jgi:hypothetical protein
VKLCFFGVFNSLNLIKKTKVYKNHHILQLVPMDNRQYGRNHYACVCVCVCLNIIIWEIAHLSNVDLDKKISFSWTSIIVTTPQDETTHKTNFVQLGSTTTWLMYRCHQLITQCQPNTEKNWKAGDGKTWICLCKMWNLASFVMEAKASQTTSWDAVVPHHGNNKKCGLYWI